MTCTIDGQTVTCELGTLAAGTTRRLVLTAEVDVADDGGVVALSATSDGPEISPDPHPNTVDQPVDVDAPNADLGAAIQIPSVVPAGQPVVLRPTILNAGPSSPAVTSVLELPADWTIVSVDASSFLDPDPCTTAGSTVTCAFSVSSAGNNRSYGVTVVPSLADDQTLRYSVTGAVTDPNPANDSREYTVSTIPATVDLGLAISTAQQVGANAPFNVRFEVENTGPANAENTTITLPLPAGTTFEGMGTSTDGFTCSATGGTLTCVHPLLGTGDHDVDVRLRHLSVGTVDLTATVSTTTSESPDTLTNTATFAQTIQPVTARVTGTVTDESGAPIAGARVELYRVGQTTAATSRGTNADGSYTLTGIAAGEYQVRFSSGLTYHAEWFDDLPTRAGAQVFVAAGLGEVHTAEAELAAAQPTEITGRIVDGAGDPIAGVVVAAYAPTDTFLGTTWATTASDGTYRFLVPDGTYRLAISPPTGSGFVSEWFDDRPSRSTATDVVAVGEGQVVVADATLAAAPG